MNGPRIKKKSFSENCLEGQFFFSTTNGEIDWQGRVIGSPEPGWYLVQMYEWFSGHETCRKLVNVSAMQNWIFFDDAEAWRSWYESPRRKESCQ